MRALTRQITRRHVLSLGVTATATAATSILAACGGAGSATDTAPAKPTTGGSTGATSAPTAAAAITGGATVAPAGTSAPAVPVVPLPSSQVSNATTTTSTTGTTSTAATGPKPMVKGNLTVMRGTGGDDVWNTRVADFKAKTGVTVNMSVTTGTVDDGTIPTALKSGSGPDVVSVNSGPSRVGFLAQANLIRPLDDAYKTYGWESKLVPAVIERLKNQGKIYQNKVWEFPATIDVIYWDYHKDVYAKAGIKAPTTFGEMNANFDKLKAMGIYPLHLPARTNTPPGWLFGNLVQAAAGRDGVADVLFANGKWDQPSFLQAATTLSDWSKKDYISKEVATLTDMEAYPIFAGKKSSTYCVGTWAIGNLTDNMADFSNIDTFEMPKITPQGTSIPTGGFGSSWVVAADSKNPDAAYAWIDYLFSDEVIIKGFDDPRASSIPTVKIPAGAKPKAALLAKAIDVLGKDGTGYNPSVHLPPTVASVYFESLQGIVAGLTAPDKAMANIQAAKVKAASQ